MAEQGVHLSLSAESCRSQQVIEYSSAERREGDDSRVRRKSAILIPRPVEFAQFSQIFPQLEFIYN